MMVVSFDAEAKLRWSFGLGREANETKPNETKKTELALQCASLFCGGSQEAAFVLSILVSTINTTHSMAIQ